MNIGDTLLFSGYNESKFNVFVADIDDTRSDLDSFIKTRR